MCWGAGNEQMEYLPPKIHLDGSAGEALSVHMQIKVSEIKLVNSMAKHDGKDSSLT